ATVFGSGDAATTMFLLTLKPGDHLICCKELYGGTIRLLDQLFAGFGIKTSYVDVEDLVAVKKALTAKTVGIWVESPTNPKLGVIDLEKVGNIAKRLKLRFIADLTFAPPCATDPFAYGAETVIYSLSKYFAGHNDVIGGAIVTRSKELNDRLCWLQRSVGAILSPDECYRVIQGIKTLEMRWVRVSSTAQRVAEYLEAHDGIAKIYYPGLTSHPGHDVIKKQMKRGFGATLSFDLINNEENKIRQFVNRLQESQIIVYGESLASPETILAHPASMSHGALTQKQRDELGIGYSFFRLSVGFEDPEDIIAALDDALEVFDESETVPAVRYPAAGRASLIP
ncbi:MAG: trans-sulfuration enzyme family protein, partial [Candidatus Saccharimonadales bacterium]